MKKKTKKHSAPYFDMQFFTSGISIMLVLMLLGTVIFFMLTANTLSAYVRENIYFTILLSDDTREADLKKLRAELDAAPYVKEAVYISKEDALKEHMEAMGIDNPKDFLGGNPLKASIEVIFNAEYANADSIAVVERELTRNKNILEFNYRQDLIDMVNTNIRKISLFLLGLAALLAFISFALISNTIRLAVYSKRFLIHTMKLVGASWGFIRRPFLEKNLLIGFTAGLFANVALSLGAYFLLRYEPQLRVLVSPTVAVVVWASVMLFGMLITVWCAAISINKYLRMKASSLYYI